MRYKTVVLSLCICIFFGAQAKEILFPKPKPGVKPHIKYVGQVPPYDYERKSSFFEIVFGEESELASPDFIGKPYGVVYAKGFLFFTDTAHGVIFSYSFKTGNLKILELPVRLRLPMNLAYSKKLNVLFVSDAALKKVFGFDSKGKLVLL
ncbi:MAG: hypothetical protein Q9M89_10455 [Persephonella sp.]|nr:hypothetical protein [Persephonella sp.]